MFNFDFKCKHKYYGKIACAVGIGILLTIIIPPWGWMISCGIGLVLLGVFLCK